MLELNKHYRFEVLIPPIAVGEPYANTYFPDQQLLTDKTIIGINVDIGKFIGQNYNLPNLIKTNQGNAFVADPITLGYLYITLYNTDDEIIFDQIPAQFLSNWNANYPPNILGTRKKNIIPINTKINFRKSYVRSVPGLINNLLMLSINFYYK
jgi:hypothetical protein